MTCKNCPHYLWKEYKTHRHFRENYCTHDSHIESLGIEQSMGATAAGVPKEDWHACPLVVDDSVEALLAEARETRFHFWGGHDMGPARLASVSALRPENAAGYHRG